MVLDGTFLASTVASVMMNGVCCVWQMQEEEARRDTLRQDIRVEYERQRLHEKEMWEQMHSFYSEASGSLEDSSPYGGSSTFSPVVEGRRRKLVSEKMRLAQHGMEDGFQIEKRDSPEYASDSVVVASDSHRFAMQHVHSKMPFPPLPSSATCTSRSIPLLDRRRRVHSSPVMSTTKTFATAKTRTTTTSEPSIEVIVETSGCRERKTLSLNEHIMLCLMDKNDGKDDGNETEEDGSLVDVPLQ